MAKAWASQGKRKTGPFPSCGMPGTASATRRAVSELIDDDSGMVKIRLESLDGDLQLRVRVRAPELSGVEAYGIKPLRIFAFCSGNGIGEYVDAVHALHHSHVSARVAWQARVRSRVDVFRAHAVAYLEPGRR